MLAGLSPDHYSRIEQGRQHTVTDEVVESLSRALQLDEVERAHLRDLAAPTRRRTASWEAPQRADPGLLRVMTTMDHVPAPAAGPSLRDPRLQRPAARRPRSLRSRPDRAFVRWLFLDPRARERIENWSDFAAAAVGALRYEVGRHASDRRLLDLVDELRATDPDVAQWWDDHGVTDRTSVDKRIAHPVGGPLAFGIEALVSPHDPEQRLDRLHRGAGHRRPLGRCRAWSPGGSRSLSITRPGPDPPDRSGRRRAALCSGTVSKVFTTSVAAVYSHYVTKVERKGRTKAELDQVIEWLTGFDKRSLDAHLAAGTTFEEFFAAASLHPNASSITGLVCGVRVEDVEDPLMQKIRYLDKLVDELAKGRAMEKVLRPHPTP